MRVYLVGGAVRDKILGKAVHDADFVVVGATPGQMLEQGFEQVGADFPVFLHPKTKQEYALARTERKSGQGYTGFAIHASPNVTLEEDLIRRDLTINAMAIEVMGLFDSTEKSGDIIDPYGGLIDIENKVLRHVASAFSEDPLRILRVARFFSRLYHDGFIISEDTLSLMKIMVDRGELNQLSRERIWTESQRATMQAQPHMYWQCLFELGALTLFSPLQHHWENNAQARQLTLNALALSEQFDLSIEQRWAVLMSSFQFKTCHIDDWLSSLESIHATNKIPKKVANFSTLYAKLYSQLNHINRLSPEDLMNLLQNSNSHKHPEQFDKLIMVTKLMEIIQAKQLMRMALESYQAISIKDIDANLTGKAIGDALHKTRVKKLYARLIDI